MVQDSGVYLRGWMGMIELSLTVGRIRCQDSRASWVVLKLSGTPMNYSSIVPRIEKKAVIVANRKGSLTWWHNYNIIIQSQEA
jgi:hypothetical protein